MTKNAVAKSFELFLWPNDVHASKPNPEWLLTFSDEFDGAEGSTPDSAKWINPDPDNSYNPDDPGDNQSALLAANAYLDGNSNLVIVAKNESSGGASYTSGQLSTLGKFDQAGGRFEVRAQMPAGGGGLWPAPLWMSGYNWPVDGEIDVLEMWDSVMSTAQMYYHWDSGGHQQSGGSYSNAALATGFHTYAVEWDPGTELRWYIDGVLRRTYTNASVSSSPLYLICDLYIGGPAGSTSGTTSPSTC